MNYSNLDVLDIMQNHRHNMRNILSGEPTKETLEAWRLNDVKYDFLSNYYVNKENTDDDFTFDFKSEVNLK